MPSPGARPVRIVPSGLSDAVDGTLAFPGAMAQLRNLILEPHARGVAVARPAMVQVTHLPDYGGGPAVTPQPLSAGNMFYGMNTSAQYAGFDRPFAYDADTNTFLPISGLTTALLPATQPFTDDWFPPTVAQIGGRVIFTHPGFPGGITTGGPAAMIGVLGQVAIGGSIFFGGLLQHELPAGLLVYGPGIAPGTYVSGEPVPTYTRTTGTGTAGATTFTVADTTGIWVGMTATGSGVSGLVTAISGPTVTVDVPLQGSFTSDPVTFTGDQVPLSRPATATVIGGIYSFVSTMAVKFGWLDISGFSTTVVGNIDSAVPAITGFFNVDGIQPGMTVTGNGIPDGTYVLQSYVFSNVVDLYLQPNSRQAALWSGFLQQGIDVNQKVSGAGIAAHTVIDNVNQTTGAIRLSLPSNVAAGSTNPIYPVTVSGALITLSQPPTLSAQSVTFTIAGGDPTAPLWGAGDLNINPLGGSQFGGGPISSGPAVFVAEMSNRAWFGINTPQAAAVQASDAGTPGTQTFESQTLFFEDGVPVTAAGALPLYNQLGGIIQSLMIFQGDTNIQQITGDFAFANIAVNALRVATGTLSPSSIASTPRGLFFAASDGVRLIDFNADITDPIGERGQGIVLPFINATQPVRTIAAFNENTYRLTISWLPPAAVQEVWGTVERTDEFWFHLAELGQPLHESRWSGPHTSILDAAAPWPAKASFLVAPTGAPGFLYRSDPRPLATSTYSEFGTQLSCFEQTLLTPDSPDGFAHAAVETTVWLGLLSGSAEVLATAVDEFQQQLDAQYVWITAISAQGQRAIPWHNPLVFRQMRLSFSVPATPQLHLGMIVLTVKKLGYQLPYPVGPDFILGQDVLGAPGAGGPAVVFPAPTFTVTSVTSDTQIVMSAGETQYDNYGATGPVTITMPPWASGYHTRFVVAAAFPFIIAAHGADRIGYLGGATVSATSAVLYSALELIGSNLPGIWNVAAVEGSWDYA
jgi:hypothetical protein